MPTFSFVLLIIIILIILYKKPYFSAVLLALTISLSPIINKYIIDFGAYTLIALIVLILFVHVIKDSLITINHIVIGAFISIFILVQLLLISLTDFQIILTFYRFIIIPFVVYYSLIYSKRHNLKFSILLIPYVIINLIIVYYRTIIDYSFFGIINTYSGTNLEELFVFGGESFRPSNLSSPIIFSIELVSFLSIFYFEKRNSKIFYLLATLSVLPLFVMSSRSSFIMLFIIICSNLLYHKKYLKILFLNLIFSLILIFLNKIDDILSIITFKEASYSGRIGSISKLTDSFINENFITILFGKGCGFANMELVPGKGFSIYVENFHLSLLYDCGIIIFFLWIAFNLLLIKFTILKKQYFEITIIIFGLLLVNMFSSNLSGYTVQIIYWFLVFTQIDKLKFHLIS